MFSAFERKIAIRYLKSGKKEGIISVIAGFSLLGVALGVAALIVVMAVMNGFHKEISAKMTGFNGDIEIVSHQGYIDDFDQLITRLKPIKEIISVTPIIRGQVMATAHGFSYGALVKGVRLEDLKKRSLIANRIIDGVLVSFKDPKNILIGKELAENLRVSLNDKVTLISSQGTNTVIGMVPRILVENVGATFKTEMYQYDSSTIFMPLSMAQTYFRLSDKVNVIEVMLRNPQDSIVIASKIAKLLGDGYRVVDWQTLNASYFNVLKTERVVMFLILTLIILVAAFNIISSLIMLVKDKTKDIAILRTIGASRAAVMRIFFMCGSLIGLIGTLIGVGLGLAFAMNIEKIRKFLEKVTGNTIFDPIVYYLSVLPAEVQMIDVIKIALLSSVLSFLATIYPAYKAAKTEPVEGLRYE